MNFDALPSDIFLKIFQDLPLKEQVRIERVNKRFREISQSIVSKWKSINLNNQQFQSLNLCSLSNLLKLCSSNLKEFESDNDDGWPLATFLKFTYPKLIKLNICTKDRFLLFEEIIKKNPNLQSLKWWDRREYSMTFPEITFEKLTSLDIHRGSINVFRSLTGLCPNLKLFKIHILITPIQDAQTFDNFFASCPKLSTLTIDKDYATRFQYSTALVHFWQQKRLRYIKIFRFGKDTPRFDDQDFKKIASSFPQFETLWLKNGDVTNEGIMALASLKKLKHVGLFSFNQGRSGRNFDAGIRMLGGCENLERLQLLKFFDITSPTLMTVVEHCRKLIVFHVSDILDVRTPNEAIEVLRSLNGIVKQNISIHTYFFRKLWKREEVCAELLKLRENEYKINFNSQW